MIVEVKLKTRDGAGRLLEVKLNSGRKMITPTFFPVYNPNIPIITPEELKKEFHWNEIITNAYIIWRSPTLSREAEKKGVHGLLGFDGVVMMDSGAYQVWMYGRIEVSNEEIVEFQNLIRPDIATFHDVVMPHNISREEAAEGVKKTLTNAEICKDLGSPEISWLATVQGSVHTDLVTAAAEKLRDLDFDYYALGSLKVATNQWKFTPQVDYVVSALKILPRDRPVHFWGLGHPATFSLFVLMGLDTFDSASYALYARDERIMFPWGTEKLSSLQEFPYSPHLGSYTPQELRDLPKEDRVKIIARHNLWVILQEIKAIREAIRGEYLFEYVQERVRVHPGLYEAYRYLLEKHWEFLDEFTPLSKKHGLFSVGEEFKDRPEVRRARKLLERVPKERTIKKWPFGDVPVELSFTYPFGQSHVPFFQEEPLNVDPREQVRKVLLYQWGVELPFDEVEVRRGRARKVYRKGVLLGTIRPHDGLFVPTVEGAKELKVRLPFPKGRVVVDEIAREPVSQGKTVFTKFVVDVDPDLRPNQEVIVVDTEDRVLAVGKLVLSPREISEFSSHPAVKVRHGAESSKPRQDS